MTADRDLTAGAVPKPKRWFRFGTRTLFVGFTVVCLAVGWGSLYWYRSYRHDQAIAAIKKVGGQLEGQSHDGVSRVYLANPEIGDAAFEKLVEHLRYVRGLRELDLVNLPITDRVAVQFYGFSKLEELYLFETDITQAGIDQIAATLPGVEVKVEAPDPIATVLAATTIYRHAIVAIDVNAAGTQMVTGSGDGTLRWWPLPAMSRPSVEPAHKSWLFAAAFHPTSNLLATAGGDDTIRIWNPTTRRQTQERLGHEDDIHALGYSADGNILYSAGDDRTVRSWDLINAQCKPRTIGNHNEQIPCLAVHPITGEVLTGSRDDTIAWWNAETGKRVRQLTDHDSDVMSLAFSPDGRLLASASYDGTVRLRSGADGATIAVLRGHSDRVFHVAFNSTGKVLASCGVDGMHVWDTQTRLPLFSYTAAQHLSAAHFARDDKWLLAADAEGFVHVIDCRSGKLFRKIATARAYMAAAR